MLPGEKGVDEVLQDALEILFLLRHGRGHPLHGIGEGQGEPADGPEPEVLGKAGFRVSPEDFLGGIVSVEIQSGFGVLHALFHGEELLVGILAALAAVVSGLVLHVEGLGHKEPVQPYLLNIDVLVPEAVVRRAGVVVQLAADGVQGPAVFLLAGQVIEGKKGAAGGDVVQIEVFGGIGVDGAVLLDEKPHKAVAEVQVFPVLGDVVKGQKGGDHAAVHIVPAVGMIPAPNPFHVPGGVFGAAGFHQAVDIFCQAVERLLLRHDVFSFIFIVGQITGRFPRRPFSPPVRRTGGWRGSLCRWPGRCGPHRGPWKPEPGQ